MTLVHAIRSGAVTGLMLHRTVALHPRDPSATCRAEPILTRDSMKPEMWANVAKELGVPWRAAEAMHWLLGEHDMCTRAGALPFVLEAARGPDPSDIGAGSHGDPVSPRGGGQGGGRDGSSGRSSDGESRGEEQRRRSHGRVLPSLAELDSGVRAYDCGYDDDEDDEDEDDESEDR